MKASKLDYNLPEELIAQHPAQRRSDARLLIADRSTGRLRDSRFSHIADYLAPGDCLVLNDTRVMPARFFARRKTGGKLEGLFLESDNPGIWEIMLKGLGKLKTGEKIILLDKNKQPFCQAELKENLGEGRCLLEVEKQEISEKILDRIGFAPLPPYIKRQADVQQAAIDSRRYQTVFARSAGAVAAPTAGFHFTRKLIERLKDKGVRFAYITLHVGAGTFRPVTTENLEDHKIHSEIFSVGKQAAELINSAKEDGGRIVAVGTTSVRTLETVTQAGQVKPQTGKTNLFIRPGYRFKIVDAMVTNFHLPRSTLLALVAAFAGLENIRDAYRHAVEQRYRFYSYGDAMLIL